MYKEAWDTAVGKELDCEREPNNAHDCYTVSVKRIGVDTVHLP